MEFRLYPEGYGEPLKVSKQGGEVVRFLQEAVWQGVKEGKVWSQTVLDQIHQFHQFHQIHQFHHLVAMNLRQITYLLCAPVFQFVEWEIMIIFITAIV